MMKIQITKILLLVSLVFIASLAGCMSGPDYEKPVMIIPEDFRFANADSDAAVDLAWWKLFDDPVLQNLVSIALDENKDLQIAASRIVEYRASLRFTKADLYPRLDIEASASRGNYGGGIKAPSTDNFYTITPVLSWELDFWGKYRRATESARAELLASEYSMRSLQISLISDVVSSYFLLLDYHQRLQISKQTLETRQEFLEIIEKRFAKGIIPEIDVNQAQIQKETAAAAIPFYDRLIAQTEHSLSILLGRSPDAITMGTALNLNTVPPEIPVGLPCSLLQRRPDIAVAEHLLHAQTAQIGVAEAMRLPSISLTGVLGGASNELHNLTSGGPAWSISSGLFGPIFNFDQDKMRVEMAKERTKQAVYNYENTVLFALREVEDALVETKTYKQEISATERKLTAARNAFKLSKLRYDKGYTSFLEVLDTERTLFQVELELSQLRQQLLNTYMGLYKALGGGWLDQEEMENAETQSELQAMTSQLSNSITWNNTKQAASSNHVE